MIRSSASVAAAPICRCAAPRTPLATTGYDTITDFTIGADKIQLDDDIFTALPVVASGVLGAAHLQIGAAATDADDRIIYNSVTGALYYDQDGNGAQAQTQFALLGTGLALTVADFAII